MKRGLAFVTALLLVISMGMTSVTASAASCSRLTVATKKNNKSTKANSKKNNKVNNSCNNNSNNNNNNNGSGSGSTTGNGNNNGGTVSGSSMTALANEVVRQTNSDRAKNGLGALTVSAELTRAACVRAQEIVSKFSHTRPDGSQWSTVSSAARGENIAKGQQTADKVMAAWMSSQGHRANILRASYKSIGVCAYKVNNVVYWVQLFGS